MGGVALSGGRGSVLGGILGAFLLTVIFNIVLLLGFPVQLQFVVKGLIIILAMAVYRLGGGAAGRNRVETQRHKRGGFPRRTSTSPARRSTQGTFVDSLTARDIRRPR